MWRISFIQKSLILILLLQEISDFPPRQEVCCLIEVLRSSFSHSIVISLSPRLLLFFWLGFFGIFLACLPVFRKSLSSKFFPFHSVFAPVCWSFGIYQRSLTLFWALSLGQEPMRFLTSWEVFRLFPSSFIGWDVVGITMLLVSFTPGGF